MTQHYVQQLVTDMYGNVQTASFNVPDSHVPEGSLEELVNEGAIEMNDIIPSHNGGRDFKGKQEQRVEETGVHLIYQPAQLARLERYHAAHEERLDQYSPNEDSEE